MEQSKKKNKNFVEITCCRLCKSSYLKMVVDFLDLPLGNNLQETKELSENVESFDLKIMRCNNCNHFQLSVSVSPELLYATNYTYLSGIGVSFVNHIKDYVKWIINNYNVKVPDVVVDIGSNDGTCLKYFKKKGFTICGVDPAQKPSNIANENGIYTINNFFNSEVANQILNEFGPVKLVTSQNVLAHVDDLIGTFKNIYKILQNGGFFIFEIGYFKKVLETKCFDTIYHEHLDYHHGKPLVKLLTSIGFDVIKIEENDIQGGSLRLSLQKTGKGVVKKQANLFLEREQNSILNDNNKLNKWASDIDSNMETFNSMFKKLKLNKSFCYGYGAPTKASLLYKVSKLKQEDISYIVEDNKLKVGKFLPKTSIPIVSFNDIDFNKKALIILFAWNFADDIIKKLKKNYNVPATILIPLPIPRIVEIC
jgi:SAM-dependent methyltransferase